MTITIECTGKTCTAYEYSVTAASQEDALRLICSLISMNAKWLTSIDRVMLEPEGKENQQ